MWHSFWTSWGEGMELGSLNVCWHDENNSWSAFGTMGRLNFRQGFFFLLMILFTYPTLFTCPTLSLACSIKPASISNQNLQPHDFHWHIIYTKHMMIRTLYTYIDLWIICAFVLLLQPLDYWEEKEKETRVNTQIISRLFLGSYLTKRN